VIASHSDQALATLSDADDRERAVLGAIGYAPNTVYLHRDIRLFSALRLLFWSTVLFYSACFHFIRRNRICPEIQSMIAWRDHRRFGVPVIRERIFEQDYAKTLATWRNNFRAARANLIDQAPTTGSGGCGNIAKAK
jgi:predicted NAD/FAD-binding protein